MSGERRPRVRGRDVIVPRAGAASVVVDDETVIYDEASNSLHVLDRVGTVVWACLDGVGTLDEITGDLAEAYGAPLADVRHDVRALIRHLDRLGLVDGVGGQEPAPSGTPTPPPTRSRSRYLKEAPNL